MEMLVSKPMELFPTNATYDLERTSDKISDSAAIGDLQKESPINHLNIACIFLYIYVELFDCDWK
jgi:hypothetical protein